ncbi:MAG: GNAT family N-acetyltransferase [Oscillospiraceae bacterium]|jgi:ribosomal protein S18 acetylase RimI-like enzyme|nr:GNAT family N-acetyltransferase [Oscillospiraceae bacterium]
MEIRPASLADLDALCGLSELFFAHNDAQQPEYCRPVSFDKAAPDYGAYPKFVIESETQEHLLATEGGAVIGFCHVSQAETEPYASIAPHRFANIVDLFVLPERRSAGVGSALLRAAADWAKRRKLDYLELLVLAENKRAHSFYLRSGFGAASTTMRLPL